MSRPHRIIAQPPSPPRNKNPATTSTNPAKNKNRNFPVVCNFTTKLELVTKTPSMIVSCPRPLKMNLLETFCYFKTFGTVLTQNCRLAASQPLVRVQPLALRRGELRAAITRLISKCPRIGWKWQRGVKQIPSPFPCYPANCECL